MKRRQFIQSIAAFGRKVDEFIRNPAIKDHPRRQVSKHVWMIFSPEGFPTSENQGMICNITVVNTRNRLVVIDSGASVQIGEIAIRQINAELKFGDGSKIYTRNGRMLSEREELLPFGQMACGQASASAHPDFPKRVLPLPYLEA